MTSPVVIASERSNLPFSKEAGWKACLTVVCGLPSVPEGIASSPAAARNDRKVGSYVLPEQMKNNLRNEIRLFSR